MVFNPCMAVSSKEMIAPGSKPIASARLSASMATGMTLGSSNGLRMDGAWTLSMTRILSGQWRLVNRSPTCAATSDHLLRNNVRILIYGYFVSFLAEVHMSDPVVIPRKRCCTDAEGVAHGFGGRKRRRRGSRRGDRAGRRCGRGGPDDAAVGVEPHAGGKPGAERTMGRSRSSLDRGGCRYDLDFEPLGQRPLLRLLRRPRPGVGLRSIEATSRQRRNPAVRRAPGRIAHGDDLTAPDPRHSRNPEVTNHSLSFRIRFHRQETTSAGRY